MPVVAAHVLCLVLAATDVVARAVRYRLLLRGLRHELRLVPALTLTIFADAMAALTPLRAGGEPARIMGASYGGVPVAPALLALAVENVLTYVIVVPAGILLVAAYGGDWLHDVGMRPSAREARMLGGALLMGGVILLLALRAQSVRTRASRAVWHVRVLLRDLARMPGGIAGACFVLSAVSLLARIGIFPLLALTVSHPPSLGVATLASFGLLYGQLAIPTPSGAGAVDVAVLKGAAGLTTGAGAVLAAWRLYTTVLVAVIGVAVGSIAYGRAIFSVFRFRRPIQ